MIHFRCPSCQMPFHVSDAAAGKKAHCPRCTQRLQVPFLALPARNATVLGEVISPGTELVPTRAPAPTVVYVQPAPMPAPGYPESPVCPSPWLPRLSPSLLLLVLCVGPLPWIELSCLSVNGDRALVRQSGVQAIWGGVTSDVPTPKQNEAREHLERKAAGTPETPDFRAFAPLVAAAFACSALGVLFALAIRPRRPRAVASVYFALLCAGLLWAQYALGLPLEYHWQRYLAQGDAREGWLMHVSYTPWFWAAVGAASLAALFSLAEFVQASWESG